MADKKIDKVFLKMDELLEKVNIMEMSIKRFNDRISSAEQSVNDIKSEVNDMKRLKASIEDKLKVQIETFSNNIGKNLIIYIHSFKKINS